MAATLQELSAGRLLLGVGAGGGRGTPYATEQHALGRPVPGDAARRAALEATIATLRSVWSGTVAGVAGFLRPDPAPPIVVGGFGPKMADLAGRVADGVNLPSGPHLADLVSTARLARVTSGRDPSTFVVTASSNLNAAVLDRLESLCVDRAVTLVQAPFADHVRRLAASRR